MIGDLKDTKIDEAICRKDTMNKIFDNYVEFRDKTNEINELFCSDDGKRFIVDVYDSFDFPQFAKIVRINCIKMCFNFAIKQIILLDEQNFNHYGYYSVSSTSENRVFKLDICGEKYQKFRGLSRHTKSHVFKLDYFSNQRRMDRNFHGDATSGKIRHVRNCE